jgi:hypothetical protein
MIQNFQDKHGFNFSQTITGTRLLREVLVIWPRRDVHIDRDRLRNQPVSKRTRSLVREVSQASPISDFAIDRLAEEQHMLVVQQLLLWPF